MYSYRIYNLNTNETTTATSIKDFARQMNLDVELDTHDNWFFHNLKNMSKSDYDYTDNKYKKELLFHYEHYILVRDTYKELLGMINQ